MAIQRIKRYNFHLNMGPQDFLMGRILRIAPAGHHPDQTNPNQLWIWALERTGTHPIQPHSVRLQAFQDDERDIPDNARYIDTVVMPLYVPSSVWQDETAKQIKRMSPHMVLHIFQLNTFKSHHDSDIGYDYSINQQPTSSNVINDIIDTEQDRSMAAAYRMDPRSAAAL